MRIRDRLWPRHRTVEVIAALTAILVAVGCTSCGGSTADAAGKAVTAKNFKVCMGTGGTTAPWEVGQGKVLQSIAKKEGWKSVLLNNHDSASTALSNAEVFISDHCNVVVEFNGKPSSNTVMALKFSAAKIPVITYDIAHKGWYFVGINNLKAGIDGGEALGQFIKKKWKCDPTAVIADQGYTAGIVNTERTGGMVTGIRKVCPKIPKSKVHNITGAGSISTTLPPARALLAAHPSWKKIAVVGINDTSVVGVLDAAKQLGRFSETYGWGQDGSLITGKDVNPHLLGSVMYFLSSYPDKALPIIKSIEKGHPLAVKTNITGHKPTESVEPCPVTAAQARSVPDFTSRLAKMEAARPGTTAYTLFCPHK